MSDHTLLVRIGQGRQGGGDRKSIPLNYGLVYGVGMPSESFQQRQVVWLMILGESSLVGVAWILGWLLDQPPWEHFHWHVPGIAFGAGASLPLLLVFLACLRWPWGPLASIKQFVDAVIRPLFGSCTVLDLAVISLLAGIGEEMLFRSVLQGALSQRLGWGTGLLIASLLFGLVHPLTPAYAVMATLFGIYLGFLWIVSDNLLVVIVAHALYDFLALVYLLRGPRSVPLVSD